MCRCELDYIDGLTSISSGRHVVMFKYAKYVWRGTMFLLAEDYKQNILRSPLNEGSPVDSNDIGPERYTASTYSSPYSIMLLLYYSQTVCSFSFYLHLPTSSFDSFYLFILYGFGYDLFDYICFLVNIRQLHLLIVNIKISQTPLWVARNRVGCGHSITWI